MSQTAKPRRPSDAGFTEKQGQYLAFIHTYTKINRRPPAGVGAVDAICLCRPSKGELHHDRPPTPPKGLRTGPHQQLVQPVGP